MMNWQVISSNPFFTVALPIIITFIASTWVSINLQNKRVDDLRDTMKLGFAAIDKRFEAIDKRFEAVDKRLDGIDHRLERIEVKLDNHAERIAKLEGPALVRVQ